MFAKLQDISVNFGEVRALNNVSLDISPNQIHAIVGENGAGKSTLMSVLFGLNVNYSGQIFIDKVDKIWTTPSDAIKAGIGMVHQHFMLIESMTVLENIILGSEPNKYMGFLDFQFAEKKLHDLLRAYNFSINLNQTVGGLSVGQRQMVEILKTLYRSAELIILDEPTAVLTPAERTDLFNSLQDFKKAGKSIILITHKIDEVMANADHVSVMRAGKLISSLPIDNTSRGQISEEIVGASKTKSISRKKIKSGSVKLHLSDLDVLGMPQIGNSFNLEVKANEIVGIAGVAGNGQSEFVEAIVGLRSSKSGLIEICGTDVTGADIYTRRDAGLCYIPEDRQKRGLALDAQLSENASISSLSSKAFANGPFLRKTKIKNFTEDLIEKFDVKASSSSALANSLSGGNKQKLIIARELSLESDVIIAENPTWGVDLGAINQIHYELLSMRENGHAILLVSSDLDEILTLSDRVLVMFESELSHSFRTEKVTREELGELMLMKASEKKIRKRQISHEAI